MEWIVDFLAKLLAVTAVLTLHEFAHAFVAYKCGDPTAKWAGRMTLNPAKHFDPLGLLCFVFAGFGWAKPESPECSLPVSGDLQKAGTWLWKKRRRMCVCRYAQHHVFIYHAD